MECSLSAGSNLFKLKFTREGGCGMFVVTFTCHLLCFFTLD